MKPTPDSPPPGTRSKRGKGLRHPRFRKIRAMVMLERTLKGETYAEVGEFFGVSADTVKRELVRAHQRGWAEEMREKLRADVADMPPVHKQIMDTPVEQLHEFSKGYKLKLDAANGLMQGLGVFRPESHKTSESVSLSAIAREEPPAIDAASWMDDGSKRPTLSDVVEGETVPDAQLPAPDDAV